VCVADKGAAMWNSTSIHQSTSVSAQAHTSLNLRSCRVRRGNHGLARLLLLWLLLLLFPLPLLLLLLLPLLLAPALRKEIGQELKMWERASFGAYTHTHESPSIIGYQNTQLCSQASIRLRAQAHHTCVHARIQLQTRTWFLARRSSRDKKNAALWSPFARLLSASSSSAGLC